MKQLAIVTLVALLLVGVVVIGPVQMFRNPGLVFMGIFFFYGPIAIGIFCLVMIAGLIGSMFDRKKIRND